MYFILKKRGKNSRPEQLSGAAAHRTDKCESDISEKRGVGDVLEDNGCVSVIMGLKHN